jgi:hypothetical protein
MRWRTIALLGTLALGACNPYENFEGEFYAGPVDPLSFGKPYLGGGDPKMGGGSFTAAAAFAGGVATSFYFFPATDGVDPTDLTAAPPAYVFDPTAASPFATPSRCKAPNGYIYDLRTDPYRLDEEGAIFTVLPDDSTYIPVVAQVPVTSNGEDCQSIKSEKTLLASTNVTVPVNAKGNGNPDGNYLAWAIVDPSADVFPADPVTFFGPTQHWGWYKRFLLTYIDGGYIPNAPDSMGNPVAITQKLYVVNAMDSAGMAVAGADPMGAPGSGLDVVEHARGQAGYSPICEVQTYTVTSAADLPTSAAEVMTKGVLDPPGATPTFVYCLGVL